MKSYSKTILLAAATLVAASSVHAATLWTTTFTGTVNTDDTSRTLINTANGVAGFTDNLSATGALTRSSTTGNFFLTGTGNTFANYNPNQNVDNVANTAGWNSVFDFNGGTQTVDLNSVSFSILRFNSFGAVQATDASVRNVNISAEYTLNGGGIWTAIGSTQLVNLTDSNTTTPLISVGFNFAAPTTVNLASDDFRIRYTVLNDNLTSGAYVGINNIVFDGTITAVPEPSTYGLLGAGALAAAAFVRRRRKVA